MDKETYDNEMDENKYKYSKQVFINITQLIVIIVLTVAVIYFSMNQKIVLKSPYSTNKDEIISDGNEDPERLNQFAYYISSLTQNITYANANEQLQKLLPLIESQNFDEVKKNLKLEATYIIRNKITQIFYVSKVDIDSANKVITIKGIRERRVSGETLKTNNNDYETVILKIEYLVKYGTYFRIKNLGVEKTK
ncbi:TraE/TraK family type IV conjugative transfer system protein [Aliarcobacter butzleri]|uniref:TraE/TraK family type IV conjugative transfer system protein n=1 Tax=Aliarcobacter butzleri TaxID=28197 RepID=A0AAP4Q057_9BACT|nr:TraE/TraK family type IV conjugative transfer system protein [Aliarcobacter butzleri]MDN5052889.1 TraE/TraK family type IV conjugative transfer system protein [Aliarcobacter butzleri]MDN5075790.1 TraE/TraK family type IV conjugative transfer system protein [Aliarcobacter butzleri]MDN5117298.1 TraE/TraK family type IV conjugative transfer system protein [Aliarcobacter butzleri]MDN5133108.1 TraE/TraK family type IV conjugative transfer system protein [Aliarcobacter butzleri]